MSSHRSFEPEKRAPDYRYQRNQSLIISGVLVAASCGLFLLAKECLLLALAGAGPSLPLGIATFVFALMCVVFLLCAIDALLDAYKNHRAIPRTKTRIRRVRGGWRR